MLNQEKTRRNLVVLIGVVTVVIFVLLALNLFSNEFEVKSSNDEYPRGEEIFFYIKNYSEDMLSYAEPLYDPEVLSGSEWRQVDESGGCAEDVFVPGIAYLDPDDPIGWDQKRLECKRKEVVFKQVEAGTYRLKFKFFETGEVYSNEFTIKE